MATCEQLQAAAARRPVWVAQRKNGAMDAPGLLLLATAAHPAHGIPAVAFVEFPDGVEPVAVAAVSLTPPAPRQPALF